MSSTSSLSWLSTLEWAEPTPWPDPTSSSMSEEDLFSRLFIPEPL